MTDLTIFCFEESNVRTLNINGQVAFCLSDVLKAIDSNTVITYAETSIVEGLGEGLLIKQPLLTNGGEQLMTFVFEGGLTFLVSRSRTELGKKFNRWLHTEILPSIRKTGSYSIQQEPKTALELAKETLAMAEAQVMLLEKLQQQKVIIEVLETEVDELFNYSSIIRVAKLNKVSEKNFNWRLLKKASVLLKEEIKKVPCPRYKEKNLYSHVVWNYVYPSYLLPQTSIIKAA